MSNEYRATAQVDADGTLTLQNLPFAGEKVEVIVVAESRPEPLFGSLRGSVLRYDRPTEPVAEQDWDALR
jgi:hypothetical protein